MTAADLGRLVALGAIWGASFLFTRIAAPAIGPVATADCRLLIGGLVLLIYFRLIGVSPEWRRWIWQYVVIGLLTSGIPFLLFAYAALELSAGLLSLFNATAPMWGALLSVVILRERLSLGNVTGLLLGVGGVALLCTPQRASGILPIAAGLSAAFFYGLAGVYLKKWGAGIPPKPLALGTQVASGVLILPFLAHAPIQTMPEPLVLGSLIVLGVLCNAIAYLLYFRLISDVGTTRALTVTYLIPLFGIAWGVLFLGESLPPTMLGGAALVVLGTFFAVRR